MSKKESFNRGLALGLVLVPLLGLMLGIVPLLGLVMGLGLVLGLGLWLGLVLGLGLWLVLVMGLWLGLVLGLGLWLALGLWLMLSIVLVLGLWLVQNQRRSTHTKKRPKGIPFFIRDEELQSYLVDYRQHWYGNKRPTYWTHLVVWLKTWHFVFVEIIWNQSITKIKHYFEPLHKPRR